MCIALFNMLHIEQLWLMCLCVQCAKNNVRSDYILQDLKIRLYLRYIGSRLKNLHCAVVHMLYLKCSFLRELDIYACKFESLVAYFPVWY